MRVIREIKRIKDKKIVVDLPEGFQAKEVEVIILPIVCKSKKRPRKLSDILLKWPSLNRKEIENIKGIQYWLREWKVHKS